MKQILIMRAQLNDAAEHYVAPQAAYKLQNDTYNYHRKTTTETQAQVYMGSAGTIRNLYVRMQNTVTPGAGKSWTFTVRKNGVDTGVTATISDAESTGNSSTDSVVIAAGDKISVGITSSGSPGTQYAKFTLEVETNLAGYSIVSGGFANAGESNYYGCFGCFWNGVDASDSSNFNTYIPHNMTVRAIYVQLDVAPGAGSSKTFRLVYVGGTQDVTISDTDTEASVTGLSIALTEGGVVRPRIIETSGPAESKLRYTVVCEAETNGYSWLTSQSRIYGTSDGYANFIQASGTVLNSFARDYYCGPTGFRIKNMYFNGESLASGADKQITLVKNGTPTALTFQVPQTEQTANNTTDEVTIDEGDYINISIDHTGGGSAGDVGNIVMSQYIPVGGPKGLPLLFAG